MSIFENKTFCWGMLAALLACLAADYARGENASACYNIADSDARTFCLARAHKEPGQCYSIKRPDLRSQCLAEVRR